MCGNGSGGSAAGCYIRWLTIADPQQAVIEDVRRIREHPLVAPDGYIYDVRTGRLVEVPEATQAGRARPPAAATAPV